MRIRGLLAILTVSFLAACGGGSGGGAAVAPSGSTDRFAALLATDYNTVVQQLYIAYFGRPADPTGLANFTARLAEENAPPGIQDLNTAYTSNPRIRAVVDNFGTSPESAALYSGNTETFLNSIYRNVLGRNADADGLRFWVDAIDNKGLTRANASFSIMAAGLVNNSPQGLADAALIRSRVAVASRFTSSLDTPAEVNAYSGDSAAGVARSMLANVNQNTDAATFQPTIDATIASITRATADRADEIAGNQIHVIYAVPSDGADGSLDLNGTIARSVGSMNTWLAVQAAGRRFKLDTFNGALDTTFVRLPKTDAAYDTFGAGKRAEIEKDLASLAPLNPAKRYAVYYDGTNPRACVEPGRPGDSVGQAAIMYIKGCANNAFAASATEPPGPREYQMMRGLLRSLGAVSPTAPNYVADGYVNTDATDVMYQGPLGWNPGILDSNKQNYYNPAGLPAGVFNLHTSPFLTQ